jgi:HD-like signal output (HDOD) protein
MVLAEEIRHGSGRLLAGKGVRLEAPHLRTLKMWGIVALDVEGEEEPDHPLRLEQIDPAVVGRAEEVTRQRFARVDGSHPFLRALYEICILRKARQLAGSGSPNPEESPSAASGGVSIDLPAGTSFSGRRIDPASLVEEDMSLASLPTIFMEVNRVINDPRSSAIHVADVISKDTSLSARLLKLVNSAFYSFPSPVDTILRAVTVVGTRQLSTLALGASVLHVFEDIPGSLVTMRSFWEHSITCGVGARMIGSYRGMANSERLFVAGLLHDIGRIVLFRRLPGEAKELLMRARASETPLWQLEIEALGFDHGRLGGLLLERWRLPLTLEHAVEHHHQPGNSQNVTEAAIVGIADLLANALEIGTSGEKILPPIDSAFFDEAGVSGDLLNTIVPLVDRQVAEILHHFFGTVSP